MQDSTVGIPWYRREEFQELRALFADGHKLHETFDEWLVSAERLEAHLRRSGQPVVRAELRPAAFVAWCGQRGLRLDAHARSEYASLYARDWWRERERESGAPDA